MQPGPLERIDAASTGDVDLSRIGRALLAKRWWWLGPSIAALIGAALFVNVVKPRYTAEAKLLLETQENFLRPDKTDRSETAAPDAEAVQSQIQLLTSRDLARRVIRNLELQGNGEFDPLAKGVDALTRTAVMLGISRDLTSQSPEDRMLNAFGDKLAVLSPNKTRVLTIEFSSRDPDLAARGANTVAEAYIEMQQDAKRENAHAAAKALGALVSDLRTRVAAAEEAAEDFRLKSNLLVGANNAIISTQQLGEFNAQLSSSRAAQADAQAKARILREMLRQRRVGDIPDVANNELIRKINEQRISLRAQLALESRTLLPAHPRIKELTAQLADLDIEWRNAAERTVRTLENEARIAGMRVENLTHALDDQKKVAGAAGTEEVHLRELERVARLLKDQLEAETAKYQEALARESVKTTPADARVIQRALAPQLPSFPKKVPITAFVTLAAMVLSVGLIIAGELLSGRARAASAAPAHPAPAVIDSAAVMAEEEVGPEPENPEPLPPSPPPRRFPRIRESFSASPQGAPAQAIKVLVASGDSFALREASVALSRALAQRGRAVLVAADCGAVEYDALVAPMSGKPAGLGELLTGAAQFSQAIHRDKNSGLDLVPAGASNGAPAEDRAPIISALAGAYDFVICATANADMARRMAPSFDMALVQGAGAAAEALRIELARTGVQAALLDETNGANAAAA